MSAVNETLAQDTGGQVGLAEADEFAALLKQTFKPSTERAETEVNNAVATLVNQALQDETLVKDEVIETIRDIIARLDEKLTAQTNEILHAPEFQQIESAWRGLHHLVMRSETDAMLKISIMNVSKLELYRHLQRFPNAAWDQSPLFRKVYEQEFGQLGGQPYGCIIGDYQFSHIASDVQLLRDMSKIAAAAHAPFFAAADPKLMGMESWNQIGDKRDISKLFDTPEYAAWKSLRDADDSKYVGLCLPRVLARTPYGAKGEPVDEFAFEEDTDGHDGQKFAWMNAAYAMAVNINRAFKEYGWCSRIRGVQSGGEVENLPLHTFPTDDGGVDQKCPTEIAISDRREAELSKAGLIPLIHRKNTDRAAFIGAQSLYRPRAYQNNPQATASSELSARLPYMFACCRFAHYLKVMVRDWVGRNLEEDQLQKKMQNWIADYIDGDPKNSDEFVKARRPLAGAKITIKANEENPGYYNALFELRPHFQLEGMDIGLRLVSRVDKQA